MKPGSDSNKTHGSDPVREPVKDDEGIDSLKVLQIVAVIICTILVAWLIFHSILHIF
jgi:hypothetical protein